MTERCPLLDETIGTINIPEVCRTQCETVWEKAMETQVPEHDEYSDTIVAFRQLPDDCEHLESQYSSDGLQLGSGHAERWYAIVDECIDCELELGEDAYKFNCVTGE